MEEQPAKRQKKGAPKESKKQVVSWCFNYFDPNDHNKTPPEPRWDETTMKFLAYQLERGGEKDGLHWQGMVQFKRSRKRQYVIDYCLIPGAHCDPTKYDDAALQYCQKSKTSQEGSFKSFGVFTNTTLPPAEAFFSAIESGATFKQMRQSIPGILFNGMNKLDTARRYLCPTYDTTHYTFDNFVEGPTDLSKAVLLFGPSGIGKTHFALAHFKKPLMVSHVEQLQKYVDHDGIVFDDMDFRHAIFSQVLALIDMEFSRPVHMRYVTASIPKGIPRIFTHNTENIFDIPGLDSEQYAAIERRIYKRELGRDLIKK